MGADGACALSELRQALVNVDTALPTFQPHRGPQTCLVVYSPKRCRRLSVVLWCGISRYLLLVTKVAAPYVRAAGAVVA